MILIGGKEELNLSVKDALKLMLAVGVYTLTLVRMLLKISPNKKQPP